MGAHKLLGPLCLQLRLFLYVHSVPPEKGRAFLLLSGPQATSHLAGVQGVGPEVIHSSAPLAKQECFFLMAQMSSTDYFVANDFIWKSEHSSKEAIEISK